MAFPGGLVVEALFRPVRSIGGIRAMVTIEEAHRDEMEITSHPVEIGTPISDHAFMLPSQLHIRAGWSKSPNLSAAGIDAALSIGDNLTAAILGPAGGLDYTQAVYAQLRGLMQSMEPMNIYTGKRVYSNMLIQALTTVTDSETENALVVDIDCRQVLVAKTRVEAINSQNQRNPEQTGGPVNRGTVQVNPVNLGDFG
jgi:hypothetical protein